MYKLTLNKDNYNCIFILQPNQDMLIMMDHMNSIRSTVDNKRAEQMVLLDVLITHIENGLWTFILWSN